MTISTLYGDFPDDLSRYVRATTILDADHAFIRQAKNEALRDAKTHLQAIKSLHEVAASLPLGFDREDIPASQVLRLRRGQCNTKTNLFIALMRSARLPARVHAWKVHKIVHKENLPPLVYAFTPSQTLFTYPEVFYKGSWQLLSEVLKKKSSTNWSSCPFDDAYARVHPLKKEWIASDLGSFWNPDVLYDQFGTNADGWRKVAFPLAQKMLNK